MSPMTEEEIMTWIANVFEEPVENIKTSTESKDIAGWDSLGILNLIAGLDENFGISVSDEEIQELRKVADILELFRRYGRL